MSFIDEIEPLKAEALAAFESAEDLRALEDARVAFLGLNGRFTAAMKTLGSLSKEERPIVGKALNVAKGELERTLAERHGVLEIEASMPKYPIDFSAPGRRRTVGRRHPVSQVTADIAKSFRAIGFAVADGPEIEDEYHCFDALNTPQDHPAHPQQRTQ